MFDPDYLYRARATRIKDGDTFVAQVDLGFAADRGAEGLLLPLPIRLHGVNSPEHNKPGGPEATAYLNSLLLPDNVPTPLLLKTYKDDRSAERWVADVWVRATGLSVALAIVASGNGIVEFGVPASDLTA